MSVIDEIEQHYAEQHAALQAQYDKDSVALEKRVEGWDPGSAATERQIAYATLSDRRRELREAEKRALQEQAPSILADIADVGVHLDDEVRELLEVGGSTRGLYAIAAEAATLHAQERRLHTLLGSPRSQHGQDEDLTWEIVLRRVHHLGSIGLGRPLPAAAAAAPATHVLGQFDSFETPGDGSATLMYAAPVLDSQEVTA